MIEKLEKGKLLIKGVSLQTIENLLLEIRRLSAHRPRCKHIAGTWPDKLLGKGAANFFNPVGATVKNFKDNLVLFKFRVRDETNPDLFS
ncbi:hypothetical protein IOC57_16240 [Bacillus sp. SD075]|uniref:hypothetical protein n=1 Tax=Bacillus sp. SD075 TaxID=2781732 RepID=UPI001A96B35C|nr:hypothetical protein [Bacillus sp. SD075]MBO0999283.1 hypothetical protein [Bacillus sp. SD075]